MIHPICEKCGKYRRVCRCPHRFVQVTEIPPCDICGKGAFADAKTTMGPWANLCLTDFMLYGVGLGLGLGQHLVLKEDQ